MCHIPETVVFDSPSWTFLVIVLLIIACLAARWKIKTREKKEFIKKLNVYIYKTEWWIKTRSTSSGCNWPTAHTPVAVRSFTLKGGTGCFIVKVSRCRKCGCDCRPQAGERWETLTRCPTERRWTWAESNRAKACGSSRFVIRWEPCSSTSNQV